MYFLAGVADVEIFKNEELLIEGKTLIDTSIEIGVLAEDIRAGKGAKLYGKYFHDTTFNLKISDVMFRLEYLAENFGTDLKLGGDIIVEESFIATDNVGTCRLKNTPIPFNNERNITIYWKHTSDKFYKPKRIEILPYNNVIELGETKIGEVYCIKYSCIDESVRKIVIGSEIVPNLLSLYLTANLYKGDNSNIKLGQKVGTITIKIPKFLLSGNQEISLNMTGFSSNTLEGSALSCSRGFCDKSLYYAEIIEVIQDRSLNDLNKIKIYADEDGLFIHSDTVDMKLKVYGAFDKYGLAIIDNEKIDFYVEDEDVLKIDSNGVIHPISDGITRITASVYGLSDSIYIEVGSYDNEQEDNYPEDNDYNNGILMFDDVFVYVDDVDILLYKDV